jgi:uncharacterized protein YjbI with pentapeptide repeats
LIAWKAAARVEWGIPLYCFASVVTSLLVFLLIRRWSASQRQWNRSYGLFWGVMGVMVLISGCMAARTFKVLMPSAGEPTKTEDILVAVPRRAAGENLPIIRQNPNDQFVRRSAQVDVPQWLQRPLSIFRINLKGRWLAQINFRGANADLADFEGAILTGATLQGAKLRDATLQSADLQGTNLRDANLLGANLLAAKLWDANFQGANLRGANFHNADLQGADFQGTKVLDTRSQGADFRGANLQGAKFGAAWLPGAKFGGAKLEGADFRGANLQGATLRGADLREIVNLTGPQIQSAHTDERTLLPDYLKKPVP